MKKCFLLLLPLLAMNVWHTSAQSTCTIDELLQNHANEITHATGQIAQMTAGYKSAQKTTSAPDTIPVIFHFILTNPQLNQIGGTAGIEERIKTQLEVMNRDYNGENADSVNIPDAFRPLLGRVNLYFGLAHTDESNNYTPGYTLNSTTKSYFDYNGTEGSGMSVSDAKYSSSGGVEAWNTARYLNIWVVNIMNTATGQKSAGTASIPTFSAYPKEEWGISMNYGAIGRRTDKLQYFMKDADSGRSIIHESGHFFGMLHIWGLDFNCSSDDSIADTPPQEMYTNATCPSFPKTDACTPDSPGVMYMNYMDFAKQECQLMFTQGQATYMRQIINTYYPDLIKHPELLRAPDKTGVNSLTSYNDDVKIFPNPGAGVFSISYSPAMGRPERLIVTDATGRTVKADIADKGNRYELDMSSHTKGIYYIQLISAKGIASQKLVLQ